MQGVLRKHPLLLILTIALAARCAAVVALQSRLAATGQQFLIAGDAEGYWMLADAIAHGQEYSIYTPPRRILRMPGFPLLLAAVRWFRGDSLLAARLLLALLGTATCGAVYWLGRAVDSQRTGLLAATAAALWPVLVAYSGVVLSETPFALFLTLSLACMAELIRRTPALPGPNHQTVPERLPGPNHLPGFNHLPGPSHQTVPERPAAPKSAPTLEPRTWTLWLIAAGIGLFITTATFMHPTWLPAAVVFPLAYWWWAGRTRQATGLVAVMLLTAALPFLPWIVRNDRVSGHLVVTTLWVGPSLYDGLNPRATGASDMRFFEDDQLLNRMSEYDMDREYRRRALEFVAAEPARALQLAGIKLWRFYRPDPSANQFSSWPVRLLVAVPYLVMLLLALWGVAAAGQRPRAEACWLLVLTIGPLIALSLVHAVFIGSLRYRLPAEYPLCVLSAVGLQSLWRSLGKPRRVSSHEIFG